MWTPPPLNNYPKKLDFETSQVFGAVSKQGTPISPPPKLELWDFTTFGHRFKNEDPPPPTHTHTHTQNMRLWDFISFGHRIKSEKPLPNTKSNTKGLVVRVDHFEPQPVGRLVLHRFIPQNRKRHWQGFGNGVLTLKGFLGSLEGGGVSVVGLSTLLRTKGIVLLHSSPAGARCSNDVSRRSCCANIDKNSCKYKNISKI